jgi:hypothetical protein
MPASVSDDKSTAAGTTLNAPVILPPKVAFRLHICGQVI